VAWCFDNISLGANRKKPFCTGAVQQDLPDLHVDFSVGLLPKTILVFEIKN
jgi:hypothetical protein